MNELLQKNHIFEGKIREYEEIIVNFSIEIGKRRGRNPIATRIMTYLLIHNKLTQKQLMELTNYSIGSISTNLAALESIGQVDKKLIQGTHTNIYSLKIDLGQNISSLVKIGQAYIIQAQKFLEVKRKELDEISQVNKNKFQPLMNRFKELEQVMDFYMYLFKLLITSSNKDFDFDVISTDSKEFDKVQDIDKDMNLIENEIIDFFITTPLFLGKNEIFSEVFAYFITRKTLNQKKLRKLTRLSVGKVSIEINKLLDLGIIEIVDKSDRGQLTYQMKSVILAFLKISANVLNEYVKWKKVVETIKEEMERNKEDLKKLNGYPEVLKMVYFFWEIMPIYEKMYSIVEKKMNELKNKYASLSKE